MVRLGLGHWKVSLGISAALLALGGCSVGNDSTATENAKGALLARSATCDDLLGKIQADAVEKVDQRVADYLADYDESGTGGIGGGISLDGGTTPDWSEGGNGGVGGFAGVGGVGGTGGAGGFGGGSGVGGAGGFGGATPPGEPSGNAGAGATGGGETPAEHSDTTTQVEGVDEADIVKTDGQHIFLLHGSALLVVDAWPASTLSANEPITIEGEPSEMFVSDGTAVIYSTVYGYGESNGGDYPYYGYPYGGYYYGSPFTKITQINLIASEPTVKRELYVEGTYVTSRRHDNIVRSVIQGGFKAPSLYTPSIEYVDAWGRAHSRDVIADQLQAWRDRTVEGIENTELSDWLPVEQERVDGVLRDAERHCDQFYAPAPGATDYGLTNIVTLDMDNPSEGIRGASILGYAGTVYANAETLVLGQAQYWYESDTGVDHERTLLHRFEIDGANTTYTASGFVTGNLINQFAIDEVDGVIRVATTSRDNNDWSQTRNRITTFDVDGNALTQLGQSANLGHEGEQIFSVRYVGDTGYVVTFLQTDPLVVVDLSDNANPKVLGEALIPGFSTFMQPFADGTHLLTIGQLDNGVQLQIFDVSDPLNPSQTHVHPYTQSGWSEATNNQKAFTFWESRGLLAFPYTDYGYYGDGLPGGSRLEVFSVNKDTGFEQLGSISHTELLLQNSCVNRYEDGIGGFYYDYYGYCPSVDVRRGLFMGDGDKGDFVYAISYGGISVHDISDVSVAVATVALPAPTYNQGNGPDLGTGGIGGSGWGGVGGVSGVGGVGGIGGTGGTGGNAGIGGDSGGAGGEGGQSAGAGGVGGEAGGTAGVGAQDAGVGGFGGSS